MSAITKQAAKTMIFKQGGKFFSVAFVKKDGTVRNMTCRREVKKYLKGGQLAYDPAAHNLITVYDMNNGYRVIPVDRLLSLTVAGKTYEVE